MSLILEALNKAEQNQEGTTNYNAPQSYPLEKKTKSKWILLLSITAACVISTIATMLVFYKFAPNNEPIHTGADNTQDSTTITTTNVNHRQAIQKQAVIPSNKARQKTNPTDFKPTIIQTSSNEEPHQVPTYSELDNSTQHREPSLHHLVMSSNYSKKAKPEPNKNEMLDEANNHKGRITAKNTDTHIAASDHINIEKTKRESEIKDVNVISNSQLADIKISVHMYSEVPAKRFVYINSMRYGEGSMINGNIFIDEITGNGVILNSHGTLYRLPLKP